MPPLCYIDNEGLPFKEERKKMYYRPPLSALSAIYECTYINYIISTNGPNPQVHKGCLTVMSLRVLLDIFIDIG